MSKLKNLTDRATKAMNGNAIWVNFGGMLTILVALVYLILNTNTAVRACVREEINNHPRIQGLERQGNQNAREIEALKKNQDATNDKLDKIYEAVIRLCEKHDMK